MSTLLFLLQHWVLGKSMGLDYIFREIELSDQLVRALSIRDYGPKILYDDVSTLYNNKDVPED
jgi:hypothetical protein